MMIELHDLLTFASYATVAIGASTAMGVVWQVRHRFGRDFWRQTRATVISSNVEHLHTGSIALTVAFRYHAGGRFREGAFRQLASPDDRKRRKAILARADRIGRRGLVRVLVNPDDPEHTLPAPLTGGRGRKRVAR